MKTRPVTGPIRLVAGLACAGMASIAAAPPTVAAPASGPPIGHMLVPASEKISIDLPDTVDRGQPLTASIGGGGAGRLEIWGPVRAGSTESLIADVPVANGFAALNAPANAGSYRLRYYDSAGRLRARAELEVAASPVELSVPTPVGAGYDAEIVWTGPANPGDMLQIVDPASGAVVAESPAAGQPGAKNRSVLRAPELAGQYQLRYWSSRGATALAELPLQVGDGIAWLRAPTEVDAGTRFIAEWYGPGDPAHGYQVFDPATGSVLDSAPALVSANGQGLAATLTAPERPGKYRVRYINSSTGFVLADLPLDVDPE